MFPFLFLIINLYSLIATAFAEVFNPILEPIFPTGISNKEAKAETEIHPVIAEAKIRKYSI